MSTLSSHRLASVAIAILSAGPAHSAEHTWTGGVPSSTGPEFSLPQNWNAAGVPVAEKNTDLLFGPVSGSGRVNPQQNLAAPLMVNQITFAAGAPAYTLTGQSFDPAQDSEGNPARVVQNSAVTQTVLTPLSLRLLPLQLTGSGTGPLVIGGAITGQGFVQVRHPGTVLSGANTHARGTEIGIEAATAAEIARAGTVTLGHAQALGGGTSKIFPQWRLAGASTVQTVSSRLHFLPYSNVAAAGLTTFFLGTPGGSGELHFTATGHVASGRTLHVDNARTTFSGGLHMDGSLHKSGPGALRLAGPTTFASGVTGPVLSVNQGTLEVTQAGALPGSLSVHLTGSAKLDVTGVPQDVATLRRLTGDAASETVLGPQGLRAAPLTGEQVTYNGILRGNGSFDLNGQTGSLLRLTNWSSTPGINGPQPLNAIDGLTVSSGTLELAGGAWLDLDSGSTTGTQTVLVANGAGLRVTGGSKLHSSRAALLRSGATVTVTGAQSVWRHVNPSEVPAMILVGYPADTPAMARLIVEDGGTVETGTVHLDSLTSPASTDPALLHIGQGSTVRAGTLTFYENGLAATIQGGTLEAEAVGGIDTGKIALGDGGRLRLQRGTGSILKARFEDLPAPGPGQPVPGPGFIEIVSGNYVLQEESSFSGKVSLSDGSSVSLLGSSGTTMSAAVIDVAAGASLFCQGASDWQLGGLSGAGTVHLSAGGEIRTLTLGSERLDADFSGILNGFSGMVKVKPNRQSWSRFLPVNTLEVKAGTFELKNDGVFLPRNTAGETAIIVGGTAAPARLEINAAARISLGPGDTAPGSLITGVEGTGVSISTGGTWTATGPVEIGKAINPGLPDAGGRGEIVLSEGGLLQTGADVTVGSSGGKGQLTLREGGLAYLSNTASLRIGSLPLNGVTSTGSVTVTGSSSLLDASHSTVCLGADAPRPANAATLTIGPGGTMVCGTLAFRRSAESIRVDQGQLTILGIDQAPNAQAAFQLTDPPAANGGAALRFGGGGSTMILDASIEGTGSLEKTGSSLLLLFGSAAYTGRTIINGGGIQLHTPLTATSRVTVTAGSLLLSGRALGNANTVTTISADGRLAEPGTVHGSVSNAGLVEVGGLTSLTFTGAVTNTGLMRFTRGAKLTSTGTFINRGTIDVISGEFIPPPGFVNEGIILDRRSVKVSAITMTGPTVRVSIDSLTGHSYQLERLPSPDGAGALRLPLVQEGSTGSTLHFEDTPPAGAPRLFYRLLVDP